MNIFNNKLSNKRNLFFYFFIYSFLGWVLETIYAFITLGYFVKRGFLFGPLCPIYGFGAIMLIILYPNKKTNSIKLFFEGSIIFTAFEYIISFILEVLFRNRWWDYTNEIYNINGRISIIYALYWGIAVILFIKHLHPHMQEYFNKIIEKIPIKILNTIYYVLVLTIIFDEFLSSLKYLTTINYII